MSGDQQPRKRKEKRKKKDSSAERTKAEAEFIARKFSVADDSDEGSSPPRTTASSQPPQQLGEGDSIIHVHHEHGTGGHWCAKIVFFLLLGALVGLIGLIIAENRGLTDLDSPAESRFSQVFDGWVDEGPFNDDHHDEHTLELKHPEDEHEDADDEHDDADIENIEEEHQSEDESDHEDEDDHDEEDGSDDAEPDDDDDEHLEQDTENNDDDDDDNASKEQDDDDDDYLDNDEKENDKDNDDDDVNEIDYGAFDDDDDEYLDNNAEEDDDDDIADGGKNNAPLEEVDSVEEEVVENHASEEEHLANAEAQEQDEEEEPSSLGLRLGIGLALVVAAYCLLARRLRSVSNEPDVVVTEPVVNRRMTLVANDLAEDDEEEEEEEEAAEEQQAEEVEEETNKKKETFQPLFNPKAAELIKSYIQDDNEEEQIIPQKIQPSTSKPQPKVVTPPPLKVEQEVTEDFEDEEEEDIEEIQAEEVQELEDVEDEELVEEEEEEIELDEEEELAEEEEEEEEDLSEEIDDTELMRRLEEKYGKLPPLRDDEPPEEDPPVRPSRKRGKPSGEKAVDDSNLEDSWDSNISDNWKEQIDLAQAEMDEGRLEEAYRRFTALTFENPSCPLAKLGRARSMDRLAEKKQSNAILNQAIDLYKDLLTDKKINDSMFLNISDRVVNRQRFMGRYLQSVPIYEALIKRFPNSVKHRNDLTISYLLANKVNESRAVLEETLKLWPNDGVALVHYGFIVKTIDNNMAEAIKYLQKGIDTGENGTLEGRFLYHLGDAYARLERMEEAKKVYELGASVGTFLSSVQRSLYNVDRLTGRPWWKPEETPYVDLIKELERNWKDIAEEALNLRVQWRPEQENLRDTGNWSQFELFFRGTEVKSNCAKCPKTCNIVKKERAASNCRRGQIKFSAMSPGTHVFAHTGPTNCRLRAHLGLIGTQDTFIRVSNETRSWQQGKVFIFDDSFDHEVWHNGTEIRIVLIVDLWHPELTAAERASLNPI